MQNKKRLKKRKILIIILAVTVLLLLGIEATVIFQKNARLSAEKKRPQILEGIETPQWITKDIISVHDSARTGTKLSSIKGIVIHYVGNPGTTAKQNRDYFNNSGTEVSSHFVVGLDGEIIQCLPLDEISAASNQRNIDTVSIEICHPDETGKFNKKTYDSLVRLLTFLCVNTDLSPDCIIRHYDVTKKACPLYYVEHPKAFKALKEDVASSIKEYKKSQQ